MQQCRDGYGWGRDEHKLGLRAVISCQVRLAAFVFVLADWSDLEGGFQVQVGFQLMFLLSKLLPLLVLPLGVALLLLI
ncbi:MAG: hypothetical protein AB8B36_13110, partial [Prochlorococcus sp.]